MPNLATVTSILPRTVGKILSPSGTSVLMSEMTSTNTYKVTSILVANTSGANITTRVYLYYYGVENYYLAYDLPVPPYSTVVVSSKDTAFYLDSNNQYELYASYSGANASATMIITYESINTSA